MRFLLCRTDGIGDLVISLPVQSCILEKEPSSEIFWLVRSETAPVLENFPGMSGVLHRPPDGDLERLIRDVRPDALLNMSYKDKMIVPAARRAGVTIRVARPRGVRQILAATHIVWSGRKRSGRHESQHALDFLKRIKWPVPASIPPAPRLALTMEELALGRAQLGNVPAPRLGAVVRGKDITVVPSHAWWSKTLEVVGKAGWSPVVLSPEDQCGLPPTDLRGLMARLRACDAVIGVSTGPTHLSAALGVPTLCLMTKDTKRDPKGPRRWAPLGDAAETLTCLAGTSPSGPDERRMQMDALDTGAVLAWLEKQTPEQWRVRQDGARGVPAVPNIANQLSIVHNFTLSEDDAEREDARCIGTEC